MVRPIRLRYTQALNRAHATLIAAGRGEELKQSHARKVMREARANVERHAEQIRLRRCAQVAAERAIAATRTAYQRQIEATPDEFDRERWLGRVHDSTPRATEK